MPDRGDERGRGGTRTLVTGILAGTEWHPAETPQEATQTAREARDLAVRLRPVLSKLAQAPRGGRRRDLDRLPAVEQLAVDAQYFASWWLPRLEGKSAQSWPSWSADGYADWVKRLDAQRVRTLEMVQGTTPVTRIASVTQLRRGKNAETPAAEPTAEAESAETVSLPEPAATEPERESEEDHGGRHALRIMPIRGSGMPTVEPGDVEPIGAIPDDDDGETRADPGIFDDYDYPTYGDPNETHVPQTPFEPFEDPEPDPPRLEVPRTPPLTGPDTFEDLEAERPQVPRTPPFTGPDTFEDLEPDQNHGGADLFFIPRTPPNTGPEEDRLTDDANATHISPITSRVAEEDIDSGPRPLFRDESHADDAAAVVVGVGAAGALGAATASAARATATRTEAG
ncbi:MAG: hypothetical protein HOV83_39885, partial [Catenulispora sp.]|nr:hypothetical protein [Catenulispora sp.]